MKEEWKTIDNINIISNNLGGWLVTGDTERFGKEAILFESPKQDECINYIRRTLTMYIRVSCERKRYSEAERLVNILMEWLEERKQTVIKNTCLAESENYSNGTLPATVYLTECGMYVKAERSPYRFTFYINKNGENVNKPRKDKIIKELASQYDIRFIGL